VKASELKVLTVPQTWGQPDFRLRLFAVIGQNIAGKNNGAITFVMITDENVKIQGMPLCFSNAIKCQKTTSSLIAIHSTLARSFTIQKIQFAGIQDVL
jgi:hypothetical protein